LVQKEAEHLGLIAYWAATISRLSPLLAYRLKSLGPSQHCWKAFNWELDRRHSIIARQRSFRWVSSRNCVPAKLGEEMRRLLLSGSVVLAPFSSSNLIARKVRRKASTQTLSYTDTVNVRGSGAGEYYVCTRSVLTLLSHTRSAVKMDYLIPIICCGQNTLIMQNWCPTLTSPR